MLQVPTPYPTALFIRDKALVVNLESIRMIVSADQVSKVSSCPCYQCTRRIALTLYAFGNGLHTDTLNSLTISRCAEPSESTVLRRSPGDSFAALLLL